MAQPIANREEPFPVIRIPSRDDSVYASGSDSESGSHRRTSSGEAAAKNSDPQPGHGSSGLRQSVQERMFASLIAQIVPSEEKPPNNPGGDPDRSRGRSKDVKKLVERPEFGARLMAANFRRFNARIGIVFVFQTKMVQLFTWRRPTATLSFLAVYTLLSLHPHLLPLVPLIIALFWVMIPAFTARHPIPANDPRMSPDFMGSPTAPPSRVKPAPDMNTDFWRNMRDLQNCMEDFSRLHDAANEYIAPLTNFSDEPVSFELFLSLILLSSALFLWAHLIPWSAILLATGWSVTLLGHPRIQTLLSRSSRDLDALLTSLRHALQHWVAADVLVHEPPERREVEIFELQKHDVYRDAWDPRVYSPSPYDPLSPVRLAGSRPIGAPFFEDVRPPTGWAWREKKWTLDLASREWVEQRMITGVEIETEGDRWVYDIPRDEDGSLETSPTRALARRKKKTARPVPKSGWEEATGLETRGEWRRRRWVRLVEKKQVLKVDGA